MDIYALLRKDHQHIKDLLTLLEDAGNNPRRQQELLTQLRIEILVHTGAEEIVFYDALEKRDETFIDNIERSKNEHDHTRHLLNQMRVVKTEHQWKTLLEALKETLENHIDTEEMLVFSVAESNFSEEEAQSLADQMRARKKIIKQEILHAGNEAA